MKHKKAWIIALILMSSAVLMLTGCTGKDSTISKEDMVSEMPNETEETKATSVKFEHFQEAGNEYAVIRGLDDSGQELWVYTTEKYSQTELNRVEEIGVFNDKYYYNESGTIIALDMVTGTVLWKNSDFGGASIHSIIGENGNIYICGYYGPDFYAIDTEGNSLCGIETFDEAYYWACSIRKKENMVEVVMEGGPEGYSDGKLFCVNLEDYSYSKVTETDNASALSNEQLKRVCEQLGVPDELNVEISQDAPVYWEAGECWTIYVTVYHAGAMVAAANVNLDTAEPVKDIWQYTSAESISGTAVGIGETWIQEDVNDPLMFEFQQDGTVFYMPTVSREAEYTTKYNIENDILTIQLVEIGATGVVPVSYKLSYDNSNGNYRVRLELIKPEKDVDVSRLYGWESVIPGWYSCTGKGILSNSEE